VDRADRRSHQDCIKIAASRSLARSQHGRRFRFCGLAAGVCPQFAHPYLCSFTSILVEVLHVAIPRVFSAIALDARVSLSECTLRRLAQSYRVDAQWQPHWPAVEQDQLTHRYCFWLSACTCISHTHQLTVTASGYRRAPASLTHTSRRTALAITPLTEQTQSR
jgi:hypothetical protein